ncbi:hypothetical protein ABT063_24740 [Streptomyces sp. NPDC002838]|uniref:hypothetical protein n=1 Tax=Streptomyces sp. NPDC002838 TaxID=3154436 RepID=UPI003323A4B8
MARRRSNQRNSNSKTSIGCAVFALLLLVGGCNALLGIGDDEVKKTNDCAMALAAGTGPKGWIGGGSNGGGGGGFTSGGGSGDGGSSSGGGTSSSGGGSGDVDVPEYEPGMDTADVTPDMRAAAEAEHGDHRVVGTEWIWFDERTNEPFPWHKKAYNKAKREADAVEEAAEALEADC